MNKAITELIRDANREITPADRHAILDLIEQQVARIAELEAQIAAVAPAVDAQPAACYQCKGCGDSEYGPWHCVRCNGTGKEPANGGRHG